MQIKTNLNLHVLFNINFVDAKGSLTGVFQKHMISNTLTEFLYFIQRIYVRSYTVITKFIYATELDDTSAAANVICNNIDNNLTSDAHPESTQL